MSKSNFEYKTEEMFEKDFSDFFLFFVAADNFRPYITSFQGNNCTDYINAVFVDVSNSRKKVKDEIQTYNHNTIIQSQCF